MYPITAHMLEVIEISKYNVSIQIAQAQTVRLVPAACGCEQQQHPQSVAIAGDRRRGGVTLACQPISKEGLKQGRKWRLGAHAAPPGNGSATVASCGKATFT